MLTKFDSKSNRVKGLSFHPKRPWILASLHNGVIQLWDYRMGVMVDRFEEHEGPVRGIDFHKSQPLFVSGGDDYKIKVWNYKLRRCLFTLLGHLDYIRTVQFHHEYPWIVSASDDQTIRIWNWQSRNCISVLTGHNHYVMCASFHPREDFIVSASLDQTVRVWDTSGLRRKTVRGAPSEASPDSFASRVGSDVFGAGDAVVKYVLEGHDRGVNWASFHPTQSLIVSGADDRLIKLWRMNETKAWEMDTLRGHTNNVSCVMFHSKHDLIISDSEDRSIRVWDVQKRTCLQTFRRENDRFWILAVHPDQNLIAAGHDNGMMVFKLDRERPGYGTMGNQLFYVRDRYLRRSIPGTASDVPLISLRQRPATGILGSAPRQLIVNVHSPDEEHVLLISNVEGGTYELYNLALSADQEPSRGNCIAAVFTGRAKFAVLDKTRQILARGFGNDPGKRIRPPYPNADFLFPAATAGRVLVRGEDRVCLFELQSRRVVAEISSLVVKHVVWSSDGNNVALIGKHNIVLADKELNQICTVSETVRVKSGVWDDNGVFIYTTLNHIKYLLPVPSGEHGIVRTLDVPVYAVDCRDNVLWVLDREAKQRGIPIDATEHLFKLALARRQFDKVLNIIKTARLCGQAVIAYLQKAGYPEIALFFVEDESTRFNLALECGNLDIALKAAKALGSEDAWQRLAAEGLRQGNFEVVEVAYQTIKAFDKLSFLYLIAGYQERLQKMLAIAEMRKDTQSRFHNALYLGNVEERVRCLESSGQLALAYLTATTYGLEVESARLRTCLEEAGLPVPEAPAAATLLLPPTPLQRNCGNWPAAPISKGAFDPAAIAAVAAAAAQTIGAAGPSGIAAAAAAAAAVAATVVPVSEPERKKGDRRLLAEDEEDAYYSGTSAAKAEADPSGDGWGAADIDLGLETGPAKVVAAGGGWGEDDLGIGELPAAPIKGAGHAAERALIAGTSLPSTWVANSHLAADHAAAGSFETAMQLLNRQIGIVDFTPLKPIFVNLAMGSRSYVPTLPSLPALQIFLQRNESDGPLTRDKSLPMVHLNLGTIQDQQRALFKAFTEGNFPAAQSIADTLFATIPFVVVQSKADTTEVKSILRTATEYKTACRIVVSAKSLDAADEQRQIELAAYMTHCALEPAHIMLALNQAMGIAFKHKNFITAANFARRLLEHPDIGAAKNAQVQQRARAVLQKSEAEARNAHKIDYEPPFTICAASLTPLYKGSEIARSPYSGAAYRGEYKGSVCVIDGMAQIGVETLGLVSGGAQTKK